MLASLADINHGETVNRRCRRGLGLASRTPLAILLGCERANLPEPGEEAGCTQGITVFLPTIAGGTSDGSLFAVLEAVVLADGSAVISYDADTPEVGDSTAVSHTRLVSVNKDGVVSDLPLPALAGIQVTTNAIPLVVDLMGSVYFYDRDASRVVVWEHHQNWRIVMPLPGDLVFNSPHPSIGPDGALDLATASQILVVRGGEPVVIAGSSAEVAGAIAFPQPPLDRLPADATSVNLPSPNALVVGQDGIIHFATADRLYAISSEGRLIAEGTIGETTQLPDGSPTTNFTGLAIDATGQLIVSDSASEELLRVDGGREELVASDVRFISDGAVLNRPGSPPLLTVDGDQSMVCAL